MSVATISNALTYVEPLLWVLAFVAFLRSKRSSGFPAFGFYLGIRAIGTCLLAIVLHAQSITRGLDGQFLYAVYFYIYQVSYLLGYIALFFTLKELFLHSMVLLPGLGRIAIRGFQWVAVTCLIVASVTVFMSLPSVSHDARYNYIFAHIADCLCVFELCMLAFLALTAQTLGLSYRSRIFGISLGFGMLAAAEFVANALHSSIYASANQVLEFVTVTALVIWVVYLAVPEPARQMSTQRISAKLLHWNDLAMAIGNNAQEQAAALATGSQTGFLQNVEGVVDRVLAKNSVNNG